MAVVAYLPTDNAVNPFAGSVQLKTSPFVVSSPPPDIRWVAHVSAELAKTAEPLVLVFVGARLITPPEPRIIYREVPVPQPQKVAFTEPPVQEVKLPEYEPALKSASTNIRVDPELPLGIKETRPPGT
jgi:hypothetical protein